MHKSYQDSYMKEVVFARSHVQALHAISITNMLFVNEILVKETQYGAFAIILHNTYLFI